MALRKLGFVALMKAVFTRLGADLSTYDFYNHVPKNSSYPYHVIGKLMGVCSIEFTTRDTEAEDNAFQIDSWVDKTSGLGDKACAGMQDAIVQSLTASDLSMSGDGYHDSIRFVLDFASIMLDPENPELGLRHGILRFRVDMAPSS